MQLNLDLQLKYPTTALRMRKNKEQVQVFDVFRKKWLHLSPEEYVRQQVLHYLVQHCHYPPAYLGIEKSLRLNTTLKRFDVVVFDRQKQPYLVIECKAPYIALDNSVAEQALRYNLVLKAPFVMITNGLSDFVLDLNGSLTQVPPPPAV